MPHFWLDYKPGYPAIFGEKIEGYLTCMVFAGDVHRLEADGADALVNLFTGHDGTLIKVEPAWHVPLTELRFKREDLESLAAALSGSSGTKSVAEASISEKPWFVPDPKDPEPAQSWYTPARYFAREFVKRDATLLTKRTSLAKKVSDAMGSAGIYKRGGKKPVDEGTVLKAFVNINLG